MSAKRTIKDRKALKILIAEDHDALRATIRDLIEAHFPGTSYFEASNGNDAVSIATKNAPDIILMDINMPEMDGLEATRRIKKVLPQTQIVILTINENHEYKTDAVESGASAYVYKRKMATELIPVLREMITDKGVKMIKCMGKAMSFMKDTIKEGENIYRTLIENSPN
jgi:DNA-binding NarL/FixJ family response regulator